MKDLKVRECVCSSRTSLHELLPQDHQKTPSIGTNYATYALARDMFGTESRE
jgi:hypothetical protein